MTHAELLQPERRPRRPVYAVLPPHPYGPYGPALRCNRCGDKNVYWQTVRGKYLLYDKAGLQPHECSPKENNLEGFDE